MKATGIGVCRKEYEEGREALLESDAPLGGPEPALFLLPMGVTMSRGVTALEPAVDWENAPHWDDLNTVERRLIRNVHASLRASHSQMLQIGMKFPLNWAAAWFGLETALKQYRRTPLQRVYLDSAAMRKVQPHTAAPSLMGHGHYHIAWLIVAESLRQELRGQGRGQGTA